MKNSPLAERVTRIKPSAPTPKLRSQRRATSSGVTSSSSARSSSMTKSLPVPWYFQKSSSRTTQVLPDLFGDGLRAGLCGLEPADAGITAEPGHLAPGEGSRPSYRARERLLERDL